MSITIEGMDKVMELLGSIDDPVKRKKALIDISVLVEASAKRNAPKGDGDLRRSITSRVTSDEAIIYTPLEYAPYREYGTGLFAESGGRKDVPWVYQDDEGEWHSTSGMHPHPFMRPALYNNRKQIERILGEAIRGDND